MKHSLEYAADACRKQSVRVGINISDNYDKELSTYNALNEELRKRIPFEFTVENGPMVGVLLGGCRKGMAEVWMEIRYKIADAEADKLLREKGFMAHFWPSTTS